MAHGLTVKPVSSQLPDPKLLARFPKMLVAVGVDEAAQMGFYYSGHTCGIKTTLYHDSAQVLEGDVIKPLSHHGYHGSEMKK